MEQLEALLRENNLLLKENQELLHKVRHFQKMSFYMRLSYWILLIGIGLGVSVYLRDFLVHYLSYFPEFKHLISLFNQIES
jgi:hypothetical protein